MQATGQAGTKRKLASAVVVADDPDGQDSGAAAKRPKQAPITELPSVKKRNQRMFGSLLGHIAKFREEDTKFKQSDAAQKRREALQQAEARKREEAVQARETAKQEMIARRQAEIDKKRDLNAQADIKKLEIMVAQRIRHHVKLAQFIRTKAGPALLWLPKSRLDATDRLLEEQQVLLRQWQEQELENLEQERQRILGRLQPQAPALKSVVTVPQENGGDAMEEDGEEAKDEEPADTNHHAEAKPAAEAAPDAEAAARGGTSFAAAVQDDRYEPTGSPEEDAQDQAAAVAPRATAAAPSAPAQEEPQPIQEDPLEEDIENPYED